jgi:hypothetical protein
LKQDKQSRTGMLEEPKTLETPKKLNRKLANVRYKTQNGKNEHLVPGL